MKKYLVKESWYAAVDGVLEALQGCPFTLVGSLDGVHDTGRIWSVIQEYAPELVDGLEPAGPLVVETAALRTYLEREAIFPGYDTLWFVDERGIDEPPPAIWYSADLDAEQHFRSRPSLATNWAAVDDWMKRAACRAGVACGSKALVVTADSVEAELKLSPIRWNAS